MKGRISLSIALALSVGLISLMQSDAPVQAQNQMRVVGDTGVVKLGIDQILRITVNAGSGNDTIAVRFRGMTYMQSGCSGGVCKSVLTSQNNSSPLLLMPNEAASYDFGDNSASDVRVRVLSNNRDVRITVAIINNLTGEVRYLDINDLYI